MNRIVFLRLCLIASCLYVLFACSDDDKYATQDVTFHVEVQEVGAGSVILLVTHNGTNRNYYCSFIMPGKVEDISQAISQYVADIDDDNWWQYVKDQRKRIIKVGGLAGRQSYTCVVFGYSETGLYGTPASITFTTEDGEWNAQEQTDWQLTYNAATIWKHNYYSDISVTMPDDCTEQYFVTEYETSAIESKGSIEEFISFAIDDYRQRIVNADEQSFWKEDLMPRSGSSHHYAHLSVGTEYTAFAIGLKSDGTPTGHYAKSEPFTVAKYPMTPYYQSLLYKSYVSTPWELRSNDGQTSQSVKLKELSRNESLAIEWESLQHGALNCFETGYSPEDGSLTIKSQLTNASTTDRIDGTKTGKIVSGEMHVVGWYINEQGDTLISQQADIARGERQDDGTYLFWQSFPGYRVGMGYVIYQKSDGSPILLHHTAINLPFKMSIPITDGYKYLLFQGSYGQWKLKSIDGKISQDIELRKQTENESLKVEWTSLQHSILYRFIMDYDSDDATLTINSQSTYDGWHIAGWHVDAQGDTIVSQQTRIAKGERQPNGSYLFTPTFLGENPSMGYVRYRNVDGRPEFLRGAEIHLPFTMTINP